MNVPMRGLTVELVGSMGSKRWPGERLSKAYRLTSLDMDEVAVHRHLIIRALANAEGHDATVSEDDVTWSLQLSAEAWPSILVPLADADWVVVDPRDDGPKLPPDAIRCPSPQAGERCVHRQGHGSACEDAQHRTWIRSGYPS